MPTVSWITPVFDRTLEDCVYGNPKGSLTVEVLQRIENNVLFIKQLFDELGISYNRDIQVKLDWHREEYLRISELRRIERNIQHLRESRLISQDTPELALSVANMPLLYTHLNDMERICFDLLENYDVVLHDRLYCGEFWCGHNKDGQFYELGGGEAVLATGVSYTVEQLGGQLNVENTVALRIVFDRPVSYLDGSKISVVNGTGAVVLGSFYGEGNTYYVSVTDVVKQGTIYVNVAPFGDFYCTANMVECTVYRDRRVTVTQLTGAAMEGLPGYYVYSASVDDMPDGEYEIALDNPMPGVTLSKLLIKNDVGTFTLYISPDVSSGIYYNTITLDAITSQPFSFAVTVTDYIYSGTFAAAPDTNKHLLDDGIEGIARSTTPVSFTVRQVGGVSDVANTTAINIIFSTSVEYLKLSDIHVSSISGAVRITELRGTGAVWVLVVDEVIKQGAIQIAVDNFADYNIVSAPQTVDVFRSKTINVGVQQEAVAYQHPGLLTFPVTADGVNDGSYIPEFSELPDGFIFKRLSINSGSGLLSMQYTGSAAPGKYTLQFSVGSVISNMFSAYVTVADYLYPNTFYPTDKLDDQLFETGNGEAKPTINLAFIAQQIGGESGGSDTTSIRLDFSEELTELPADAVEVSNLTGQLLVTGIRGAGTTWYLDVETLQQGTVQIAVSSFANYLVVTEPIVLTVFVQRRISGGEQSRPVLEATATRITYTLVCAGYANGIYTAQLSGAITGQQQVNIVNGRCQLAITVPALIQGNYSFSVSILEASTTLQLYITVAAAQLTGETFAESSIDWRATYAARLTQLVGFTVKQLGGEQGVSNTAAIEITFDKPVSGLTAEYVHVVTPGIISVGELTGEGTNYLLAVTEVFRQGEVTLTIDSFDNYSITAVQPTTEIFAAQAIHVGEQNGAIAEGLPGSIYYMLDMPGYLDGVYQVTYFDMPSGLQLPSTVKVTANSAKLVITTSGAAKAGKYYPNIQIDGKESNSFLLAITN